MRKFAQHFALAATTVLATTSAYAAGAVAKPGVKAKPVASVRADTTGAKQRRGVAMLVGSSSFYLLAGNGARSLGQTTGGTATAAVVSPQ